jgi:hypothetical protein
MIHGEMSEAAYIFVTVHVEIAIASAAIIPRTSGEDAPSMDS